MARLDDEFELPPPPPPPPEQAEPPVAPDPFDPARLRLHQDYAVTGGVQRHMVSLPVRKPTKEEWVRACPGEQYTLDTLVLELKDAREVYLIDPALRDELAGEPTVGVRRLVLTVNRSGSLFIWPLRLPTEGKTDRWAESALLAVEAARSRWVRVRSDMKVGAYEYWTPFTPPPEPVWPEIGMGEALRLAFRSTYIDSLDHPVLRRLQGRD